MKRPAQLGSERASGSPQTDRRPRVRCATQMQRERQPRGIEANRTADRRGTPIAIVRPTMTRKIEEQLRARADRSEFGKRLLEISKQVERDFEGQERERLRVLVAEALERHFEIRESAKRTRAALDKLRSDQHTLLRLFDFITASPDRETIH